ncbi:DMT family transporter [Sinanaerobacter chloroacetimidivorans]|uniref:DMT family transporter n=1 Tax=Sinanaerobacter chloroacetimidivorans TaxID=2818044 RepID=A0A8J7W747_9FIRM|nr:DMT family transporter [Sinanaerobacter chloroacetimidivorans]MBR0600211.1 DMT family transporter [Sinanaerobacter chloroacetimidivorans]
MNIFERNAKKVVVAGVLSASTSAIFIRLINASSIAVGFYRLTYALPFFTLAVIFWHKKELLSITRRQLMGCILAGLFLSAHFFTWFTSIENTTVASAVVICSTHPIIILAITALVLREKTNLKAVAGVLIALLGAAIITGGDYSFSGNAIYGDIMAFLGAIFLALYFLAGRRLRKNINATVYVFLVFSVSWVVFTIGMFATKTPFTGYSSMDYGYLFAMAIVCQIGAHAVFNWCLGHVTPLYISTIENGEAIFASAMAVIFFGEIPTLWQLVGGIITICGLLYYNYHEAKLE